MRTLSDVYAINRNFQKSARIDSDLAPRDLDAYRLNASGWRILDGLAEDVARSKQRAFTWTGPYGSGKSSLALLLAAALGPAGTLQKAAVKILGPDRANTFYGKLPTSRSGWLVVTVVGRRTDLVGAIWDAFEKARHARWGSEKSTKRIKNRDLSSLLTALEDTSNRLESEGAGLLLLVDEMGKLLEHAALTGGDIFPLQEIAEVFGRGAKRAVLLGILHQAFGDYGRRFNSSIQAEWAKIQGRFSDTPFSIGLEEVIALVAAAIDRRDKLSSLSTSKIHSILGALENVRIGAIATNIAILARCVPLHPVTALLLAPVSRRRFGQNERSVFSFLSSHEPFGFSEFLSSEPAESDRLFEPSDLWDYLQVNYEPAILSSPDGPRWAEAAEAVLRAERRQGASVQHVKLAKAIALLDLFGRPYGITATDEVLTCCCDGTREYTAAILNDLKSWSVAIPRRHIGGWGLFAGSDLDIDAAVAQALERVAGDADALLGVMRDLSPIVAKRHYAETGTLRLFERRVVNASEASRILLSVQNETAITGSFLLVVPEKTLGDEKPNYVVDPGPSNRAVFVATLSTEESLLDSAKEVAALERLPSLVPQLQGDPAARRELNGRLLAARATLSNKIREAFERAEWRSALHERPRPAGPGGLSALASALCDFIYKQTPKIDNELLNRERPSPAAVAARKRLLLAMVLKPKFERLGIEGEPAELGLYLSLLAATGVHRRSSQGELAFVAPVKHPGLSEAWAKAERLLSLGSRSSVSQVSLQEIYDLWRSPPYGMRDGVMPVFALALYLSNAGSVATYLEGNYIPDPGLAFVERLLQEPKVVSFRWVGSDDESGPLLRRLAAVMSDGNSDDGSSPTALSVAKPLVQFALRLPGWTRRTRNLSPRTLEIREALLNSTDPYTLIFREIVHACGVQIGNSTVPKKQVTTIVECVKIAIDELRSAQQLLLEKFCVRMLRALHAKTGLLELANLARRAEALKSKPMDLRIGRFAQILAGAPSDSEWLDAVCSLAANRPLREWTDGDVDRCQHELDRLSRGFLEVEASVTASAPDSEEVHKAAFRVRAQLDVSGLDAVQQRAALLLALEQLAPKEKEQEAA